MTTKQNAPRGTGRQNDYWDRIKSTVDDTTRQMGRRPGNDNNPVVVNNRCEFCEGHVNNLGRSYHDSCGQKFQERVEVAVAQHEIDRQRRALLDAHSKEADAELKRRAPERTEHWAELQPWLDKAKELGIPVDFL